MRAEGYARSWTVYELIGLKPLSPTGERKDEEEDDRSNYRHHDIAQETIRRHVEEREKISAKERSENSDDDVPKKAKTGSLGQFSRNPA